MSPLSTSSPSAEAPAMEPSLEQFFERVRALNPFIINRVVQPSAADVDADSVHQGPFQQLVSLARTSVEQRYGIGVVLWGEAGVGKSHLLSRLSRWADREKQACFVYLQNLQASPETLPRSLLRATVSILTEGRQDRWHETTLYRLVNAALKVALHDQGITTASLSQLERAYQSLLDRLAAHPLGHAALVDRTVYDVLFRFFRSALQAREQGDATVARLAVRWLSGDYLDPDEARQLGLHPGPARDEPVALTDDQQIKLVLVALSQIALFRGHPLLLCFDQAENLTSEQMNALARFLQALLDSSPNLLAVTCGVKEELLQWQGERVIPTAAWDRIAQDQIDLHRVSASDARKIVQVRLLHFLEPFEGLPAVRDMVKRDDLFPLGAGWFDEFFQDKTEVRPRDAVSRAREGWDRERQALRERGGKEWLAHWPVRGSKMIGPEKPVQQLIDEKVAAKLAEQRSQRQLDPQTLPPDADNLAGLVHGLLQQCLDREGEYDLVEVRRLERPRRGPQPPHQLLVRRRTADGGQESLGVLFLATGSAVSAGAYVRRLSEDRDPPQQSLLVTDRRLPLKLGAAGRDHLEQVRRKYGKHFRQIELTFDQYAELDALQVVVGMAGSGDLEVELPRGQVHRVEPGEVIDSHHRHGRYTAHPLLGALLGKQPEGGRDLQKPVSVHTPSLDQKDLREVIMSRLALMPGASSHELTTYYVDYLKTTRGILLDPAVCKPGLEEVARRMHHEGLVNATPIDDGLFLLPRRR